MTAAREEQTDSAICTGTVPTPRQPPYCPYQQPEDTSCHSLTSCLHLLKQVSHLHITSQPNTCHWGHSFQQVTLLPLAAHLPISPPEATCGHSASKLPSCHLQPICQQVLVTTSKHLVSHLRPTFQQALHLPLAAHLPASTLTATCGYAGKYLCDHTCGTSPSKYLNSHLRLCQQAPYSPASTSATGKYLSNHTCGTSPSKYLNSHLRLCQQAPQPDSK